MISERKTRGTERSNFERFLCDTWWYGLTRRVDDKSFERLAELRVEQGFTTVQMVVGVPPEVGPENVNASSKFGPAWNLSGEFNQKYLEQAREKVEYLNSVGLSAILYGAWGYQIEWLGEERMKNWWNEIIKNFDDLDVMYCITGESDLWVGGEKKLLPNRTTGELNTSRLIPFLPSRLVYVGKRLIGLFSETTNENRKADRCDKWSRVLSHISLLTNKPIFIHVTPNITSQEAVSNPELLAAVTVQTGHSENSRRLLWELPLDVGKNGLDSRFVNLEPWYEGITGRFKTEDQMYAYWVSMMAGAYAYCYGAHGIWNAGDGKFLAHWGGQTMNEAMKLKTPNLLGQSHKLFIASGFADYLKVDVEEIYGELIKITRTGSDGKFVSYVPEMSLVDKLLDGEIFLPLSGEFTTTVPKTGQVVVISK